jgi:hypothetical protein
MPPAELNRTAAHLNSRKIGDGGAAAPYSIRQQHFITTVREFRSD